MTVVCSVVIACSAHLTNNVVIWLQERVNVYHDKVALAIDRSTGELHSNSCSTVVLSSSFLGDLVSCCCLHALQFHPLFSSDESYWILNLDLLLDLYSTTRLDFIPLYFTAPSRPTSSINVPAANRFIEHAVTDFSEGIRFTF